MIFYQAAGKHASYKSKLVSFSLSPSSGSTFQEDWVTKKSLDPLAPGIQNGKCLLSV